MTDEEYEAGIGQAMNEEGYTLGDAEVGAALRLLEEALPKDTHVALMQTADGRWTAAAMRDEFPQAPVVMMMADTPAEACDKAREVLG